MVNAAGRDRRHPMGSHALARRARLSRVWGMYTYTYMSVEPGMESVTAITIVTCISQK